jgi:hypothetical protein
MLLKILCLSGTGYDCYKRKGTDRCKGQIQHFT